MTGDTLAKCADDILRAVQHRQWVVEGDLVEAPAQRAVALLQGRTDADAADVVAALEDVLVRATSSRTVLGQSVVPVSLATNTALDLRLLAGNPPTTNPR